MSELNIVVLVKQVPDPSVIKISEDGRLMREGVPSVIDPFGKMALLTAVSMKQKHDVKITAISMGPKQAENVLRKCLEHGADRAVLLSDKQFAGSDTWATAYTLSKFIEKINPDIILCGMQATDGDTAQVPAELSVLLDYSMYSHVIDISDDFEITQSYEKETRISELKMPAVVSVSKYSGNAPVLPNMNDFVRARSMDIETVTAKNLDLSFNETGIKGSKTRVVSVTSPEVRKINTEYIDGSDASEAVNILRRVLNE